MLKLAAVALSATFASAYQNGQQPVSSANMFTPDERGAIVAYWSSPGRYQVGPPEDFATKGLWQVRLTVEGSKWLKEYDRLRNVSAPPTAVASPANPQQQAWDAWLTKKVVHDRWQALQVARAANQQLLHVDAPKPDRTTPVDEPPAPGPIPADMLAAVGDPPPMASAVAPMAYTVNFDDGPIQFVDNVRLGSPSYRYYRFAQGVMSEGQAVKDVPAERLAKLCQMAGCDESQARIMRAVSQLEGGFDAINTYDTGFVSIGFIQFASLKEGAGSLGAMLAQYRQDDPIDFASDFHKYGIDVTPAGVLDFVNPSTGAEVTGSDANMRTIEDKRLVAVFERAGRKSDSFCAAQIKAAKLQFFPADDLVTISLADGTTIGGKVSDFIKSEAGVATLFDRKVNTGKIALLTTVATQFANQYHCKALTDLAPYEGPIVAAVKYRMDFTKDPTLSQPPPAPVGQ